MQYEAIRSGNVAVCFFVGLTEILPAKYIMKMDDDAFVRIDEVLFCLKGKVSNGLLYGLISVLRNGLLHHTHFGLTVLVM